MILIYYFCLSSKLSLSQKFDQLNLINAFQGTMSRYCRKFRLETTRCFSAYEKKSSALANNIL